MKEWLISIKFNKIIIKLLLLFLISTVLFPTIKVYAASADLQYYAINDVNLRSKRDFSSSTVTTVPKNQKMTVKANSEDKDGWVEISYKNYKGYMKINYLTMLNPLLSYGEYYAPSAVNLRASRDFSSAIVVTIPVNQLMYVEDGSQDKNGWVRIIFEGRVGYMKQSYISVKDPTKNYINYYAPNAINMRESRTFDARTIGTIPKNQQFYMEEGTTDTNGWAKILYQGKVGYMKTSYFSITDPTKTYGIYYAPSVVNLRAGRSFDTAIVESIPQNRQMYVEDNSKDSSGWVKIISQNGVAGYMRESYLTTYDPTKTYFENYAISALNIRSKPDYNSETLVVAPTNAKLYVEQNSLDVNGWLKVAYNGRVGYMKSAYITAKMPNAKYTVKYATGNVNLRQSRTYDSKTVTVIPESAKVEMEIGSIDGNNWAKFVYGNTVGYMNVAYFSDSPYQPIKKTYKETAYTSTFSSALTKTMAGNPQTDKKPANSYINVEAIKLTGTNKGTAINANGQVRSTASKTGFVQGKLKNAEAITILSTVTASDGSKWYKFNFNRQWFNAAQVDTSYYLNPNNFDKSSATFLQFLVLSKPAYIDVNEANKNILAGKGILANKANSFSTAATTYNVNEIYLISHALLETGNGTSQLANGVTVSKVDGKPVTPKKVYNMYGIGAVDSDPLRGGSEYAYKQGWDTPEKAIIGGANFVAQNYISKGQDTLYKMRYNPANPGVHLYATDIGWAIKQTTGMQNLYKQLSSYTQEFDVPKYK
ncbi:SH3 domain-containing protein [Listeria welshimeri]|nr:SH3 domain-containing protein [Listeria welshimeri]MBC1621420.1 SH3 domain-containing protein [Listeria welshimeri]MBC1682106.1 SH3 domain-containing protein [Listeria welshimeri]MBC1684977.1 SH3 domain-containing protein [Listeria welshimeri]MBC1695540.1 SH3 domain-containing protein [Listeria welshimeri]